VYTICKNLKLLVACSSLHDRVPLVELGANAIIVLSIKVLKEACLRSSVNFSHVKRVLKGPLWGSCSGLSARVVDEHVSFVEGGKVVVAWNVNAFQVEGGWHIVPVNKIRTSSEELF